MYPQHPNDQPEQRRSNRRNPPQNRTPPLPIEHLHPPWNPHLGAQQWPAQSQIVAPNMHQHPRNPNDQPGQGDQWALPNVQRMFLKFPFSGIKFLVFSEPMANMDPRNPDTQPGGMEQNQPDGFPNSQHSFLRELHMQPYQPETVPGEYQPQNMAPDYQFPPQNPLIHQAPATSVGGPVRFPPGTGPMGQHPGRKLKTLSGETMTWQFSERQLSPYFPQVNQSTSHSRRRNKTRQPQVPDTSGSFQGQASSTGQPEHPAHLNTWPEAAQRRVSQQMFSAPFPQIQPHHDVHTENDPQYRTSPSSEELIPGLPKHYLITEEKALEILKKRIVGKIDPLKLKKEVSELELSNHLKGKLTRNVLNSSETFGTIMNNAKEFELMSEKYKEIYKRLHNWWHNSEDVRLRIVSVVPDIEQ
ncbi:hypothetical protein CRE_16988 [Caenorhabditis remanei]|uniref:CUT domain-containing protein n=1 Tax=Caenorhabditis remanei TaxID=31234 RepID=E3N2F5_CAERE|nr:hypothetical protein CRE_16988 [Caenorhabditis remanei]